jgi:hypothetical protein
MVRSPYLNVVMGSFCQGAQNGNQTHVMWLKIDIALYPGIKQSTLVFGQMQHRLPNNGPKMACGPFDAQGPSHYASGTGIRLSLPNTPLVFLYVCCQFNSSLGKLAGRHAAPVAIFVWTKLGFSKLRSI